MANIFDALKRKQKDLFSETDPLDKVITLSAYQEANNNKSTEEIIKIQFDNIRRRINDKDFINQGEIVLKQSVEDFDDVIKYNISFDENNKPIVFFSDYKNDFICKTPLEDVPGQELIDYINKREGFGSIWARRDYVSEAQLRLSESFKGGFDSVINCIAEISDPEFDNGTFKGKELEIPLKLSDEAESRIDAKSFNLISRDNDRLSLNVTYYDNGDFIASVNDMTTNKQILNLGQSENGKFIKNTEKIDYGINPISQTEERLTPEDAFTRMFDGFGMQDSRAMASEIQNLLIKLQKTEDTTILPSWNNSVVCSIKKAGEVYKLSSGLYSKNNEGQIKVYKDRDEFNKEHLEGLYERAFSYFAPQVLASVIKDRDQDPLLRKMNPLKDEDNAKTILFNDRTLALAAKNAISTGDYSKIDMDKWQEYAQAKYKTTDNDKILGYIKEYAEDYLKNNLPSDVWINRNDEKYQYLKKSLDNAIKENQSLDYVFKEISSGGITRTHKEDYFEFYLNDKLIGHLLHNQSDNLIENKKFKDIAASISKYNVFTPDKTQMTSFESVDSFSTKDILQTCADEGKYHFVKTAPTEKTKQKIKVVEQNNDFSFINKKGEKIERAISTYIAHQLSPHYQKLTYTPGFMPDGSTNKSLSDNKQAHEGLLGFLKTASIKDIIGEIKNPLKALSMRNVLRTNEAEIKLNKQLFMGKDYNSAGLFNCAFNFNSKDAADVQVLSEKFGGVANESQAMYISPERYLEKFANNMIPHITEFSKNAGGKIGILIEERENDKNIDSQLVITQKGDWILQKTTYQDSLDKDSEPTKQTHYMSNSEKLEYAKKICVISTNALIENSIDKALEIAINSDNTPVKEAIIAFKENGFDWDCVDMDKNVKDKAHELINNASSKVNDTGFLVKKGEGFSFDNATESRSEEMVMNNKGIKFKANDRKQISDIIKAAEKEVKAKNQRNDISNDNKESRDDFTK